MRHVVVIGMGAGDPSFMTVEAVEALRAADVLFVLEKAEEVADLVALRHEIVARFAGENPPRVVARDDPPRARGATSADQRAAVRAWRDARTAIVEDLLRDELEDGQTGAFLVWGDPSLYDSLLGVLDGVLARGAVAFRHRVVPGISAVAALAARHRIAINRVGGAVQLTTGRRLAAEGLPQEADDVVVMLDADLAFRAIDPEGVHVYWGAYLGTPDELLLSGPLAEVGPEIERVRAAARQAKGWMFDTYLLRRAR